MPLRLARQIRVTEAAVSSHSCADTLKHCLKYDEDLQNKDGSTVVILSFQMSFETSSADNWLDNAEVMERIKSSSLFEFLMISSPCVSRILRSELVY